MIIKILVACGENYTVAVTIIGQVYSCGNNDYGQLGHEKARKRLREYKNFQLIYNLYLLNCEVKFEVNFTKTY